jgi:hypothetical protein
VHCASVSPGLFGCRPAPLGCPALVEILVDVDPRAPSRHRASRQPYFDGTGSSGACWIASPGWVCAEACPTTDPGDVTITRLMARKTCLTDRPHASCQ